MNQKFNVLARTLDVVGDVPLARYLDWVINFVDAEKFEAIKK